MINLDNLANKYRSESQEKTPMLSSQAQILDKDGKLQRVNIDITDRCNYACLKCFRADEVGPDKEEMEYDLLTRIVDEAVGMGVQEIGLHGGEPTTYGRFDDLMVYLRQLYEQRPNFFVTMFTNGSHLYDNDYRRKLVRENKFLEVYFSIETFDASDYEKRTRCPEGSFATVLQNLEYALQDGLADERRLALTFTLSRDNLGQAENVWRFCRTTGIIPRFTFLVNEGRAAQYLADEVLSNEERESIKERIAEFDRSLGYVPIISRKAIGIKHFMAFNMLGISTDGTTNGFNGTISGLDVREESLRDIWSLNLKRYKRND